MGDQGEIVLIVVSIQNIKPDLWYPGLAEQPQTYAS
jgi:hypothetical protein